MKKIIKKILRFIGKIIKCIDLLIVTPIMKLFIKITDVFKVNSKGLERILISKQALLVISLLIAWGTFYLVDHDILIIDEQTEILTNQPVSAIYNQEAYVVEGLPEKVDVFLIGHKTHIYLAKQQPKQEISVDLRELSAGTHRVKLKYRQRISSVNYQLNPSTVTVVIYDKVSSNREVTYEILHRDKLDSKLDIASVKLSKSEVTIKGASRDLDNVAYVKALVDVENLVNPVAGTTNINGVKLIAYNNEGEIVKVEILPETLDATLKLVSSSKQVPIKIVPEGNLALGYAIDSLTSNYSKITIFGNDKELESINYVPVYVDISNVSTNKDFTVNISKPNGVRDIDIKTLNIKLTVDKEIQKEIKDIGIQTANLNDKFNVLAANPNEKSITVIVKGTAKNINALDTSKIIAQVDLSEITKAGEYDVLVDVIGEDLKLNYTSKTKKVKVRIYNK